MVVAFAYQTKESKVLTGNFHELKNIFVVTEHGKKITLGNHLRTNESG